MVATDHTKTMGGTRTVLSKEETQNEDSKEPEHLANPEHCKDYLSNKAVQIATQNCIKKNQRGQEALERAKGVVVNPAQSQSGTLTIEKFKETNQQNATDAISNHMDRISQFQQKVTKDKIIKKFQSKYEDIPPGKVLGANQELHNSLDELDCIFRELRKNLSKMVGSALDSMLDRYINVPPCAAGNVTAAILGRMLGFINSAMDKIMKPLESLMGLQDLAGTIGGGGGSKTTSQSYVQGPMRAVAATTGGSASTNTSVSGFGFITSGSTSSGTSISAGSRASGSSGGAGTACSGDNCAVAGASGGASTFASGGSGGNT